MFDKFSISLFLFILLFLIGVCVACGAQSVHETPPDDNPPLASFDEDASSPSQAPSDGQPRVYGEQEPTPTPTPSPSSPLSATQPPKPRTFSFETPMVGSPANRTKNLQLVAKKLNGYVIKAGQTFSFNKVVGPRTLKRGYRKAIIFVDKNKVMEVGGGVCQISSTLYNVALKAQFEIVERHQHGREVPYIELGKDATVFYGRKDLRFTNTSSSDYMIRCVVEKKRVFIEFVENVLPDGKK